MSDGGRGRRGVVYEWRHNWIPLTPRAALLKAKGDRQLADRLVPTRVKGQRNLPTREDPGQRVKRVLAERAQERRQRMALRDLSDDALADRLAADADDDASVGRVLAELDRRDRVEAAKARQVDARRAARDAAAARKDAEFDRRLGAGDDPEEAYAAVYGVAVEKQRRIEAAESLRSAGYKGRGFDELVRSAFQDHARQSYLNAEDVTRGVLVNKAGQARGVHGGMLFTGPESRARKWASRELLDYWQEHGRMTVDDFRASLIGGAMRSAGTAAFS